jgi:hypothetical protein
MTRAAGNCCDAQSVLPIMNSVLRAVVNRSIVRAAAPIVAAALIVSGCGQSCTAVGCVSGLTVRVPRMIDGTPIASVRLCADGRCATQQLTAQQQGQAPSASIVTPHAVSVNASVTVYGANRKFLLMASDRLKLHKNAPNGVSCGPICYYAAVTLQPNGALGGHIGKVEVP